jgi:hypothetical protein
MTTSPDSATPAQARAATKQARFESLGLLLLSLATVGTAWCSYQATTWGAAGQRIMNQSVAASRRAATDHLRASQVALLDVLLFSQHINARAGSNEPLARFYAGRFRGEARVAFDAWMATRPFENPEAPPHPFVTNLYRPQLLIEVARAEDEAQRLQREAGEAGRNSRTYVLVTVLLASALYCGGTAAKFDTPVIRRGVLLLGLAAFVFAVTKLWSLPVQL